MEKRTGKQHNYFKSYKKETSLFSKKVTKEKSYQKEIRFQS